MADPKEQVEALKTRGNESLKKEAYWSAIQNYSEAITLDPGNAALYSNRSVAQVRSGKFAEALDDAEQAIKLNPKWAKAYMRKGHALQGMKRHEEAVQAFKAGLEIDPENTAIQQGMTESEANLSGPGGSQPIVSPFADANLWEKIANDPTTREYLTDPHYKEMVTEIQRDPTKLADHMKDARIMTTMGLLLGIGLTVVDGNTSTPSSNAQNNTMEALAKAKKEAMARFEKAYEDKNSSTEQSSGQNGEARKEENMDTDDLKLKALAEKDLGNAAYKKKEFDTAIQHYEKAIELDPTNITFRTNKAAVYFEKKEYDECIQICTQAIDVGRENRADYKLIAKAFARIGNSYSKKEDYDNAIKFYNKSLSESRDRDIARKVQEINKLMAERVKSAYINPELSVEEKNKGNEAFKKADYPTAIKHYTEAVKRNPEDAKIYSNRAACYTKLAEFTMALKDADECIRLDPNFIKGYLRKGNIQLALKSSQKSADAFQQALDLDSSCQEAIDGYRKAIMLDSGNPDEVRKRAMQNPEVQQILADPAMQLILQQMQKDPRALQEHLKDPNIAKKIEKLMECGLIAVR